MKKIINGKRYDTDTAKLIETWHNKYANGDFQRCSEWLYLTQAGNWFVTGSGGPMSTWAVHTGNESSGGSGLRALTAGEAYEWLEDRDFSDALEQYFSEKIINA